MKKMIIILALFFCKPVSSIAQVVNWANLTKAQPHIITVHAGVEHGVVFGLGYGYRLRSRLPLILDADYSFPGGKNLLDDLKTKLGGQVQFYKAGNFLFSAKLYGIFRRYENDFARLLNFGSDVSAAAGYYKPTWFVAAEGGFDKAIITHVKNAAGYKAFYPLAKDGWYEPSTGGNFYYGLQAGYAFKQADIYIKAGKIITQDLETDLLIPVFIQLGINARLGK